MPVHSSPLDHVRIAAPCSAGWERMTGDERVRFCEQCNLNVYNLSGMSKNEAETLVTSVEGRLCVRFYRRADGTILTKNCPNGLRAVRQRLSRIATGIASAVLGFVTGVGFDSAFAPRAAEALMGSVGVFDRTVIMEDVPPAEERTEIELLSEPVEGELIMLMGRTATSVEDRPEETDVNRRSQHKQSGRNGAGRSKTR